MAMSVHKNLEIAEKCIVCQKSCKKELISGAEIFYCKWYEKDTTYISKKSLLIGNSKG
ncbi:MAG: hypothetical protein PWP27_1535 [Clostridiales bacterium]|jgi:hypothetical protein|nr:hypothetical protein [Clostridiales bacterium]MDK2933725.1 hypothetical protein [Clostridiales bacterium]